MLKNLLQAFIAFILSFGFTQKSMAQLSQGGTPKGFDPTVDNLIPVERMPSFDVQAMLLADDTLNVKGDRPYRFGNNFNVNISPSNSGRWVNLPTGGRIWQVELYSPGAYSINLQFSYFQLPPDAQMFVYNKNRSVVLGAFTHINNQEDFLFATDLVAGERIIVEYFEPSHVIGQGNFTISTVTHAYRDVFALMKNFGDAGNCHFNVVCPLSAGWENEIRSVVMLVSGGSGFCTGALVNNTSNDGRPYVLTANHCGSSGFGSWVFRFNWQSATCANPASSPSSLSLTGAVQRASSAGSDFSLVEITGGLSGGTIPQNYNAYFAGWNNVNSPADSAFCIHHPSGDIKKISKAQNATISSNYSGAQTWRVGQWTAGCTEPGSSGSPLFDQDHYIVGQLYGGPSACGLPASSMYDHYGKFATSWLGGGTSSSQLKVWLDPTNTGATTLPGYDPFAVSYNNDASVFSILTPASGFTTCNTTITPVVKLKNFGQLPLTSVSLNYQVDAGTPQVFNWTGNLTTGQTQDVTLNAISGISVGNHTLTVFTSNPNGASDSNAVNDQKTNTFTIATTSPMVNLPVFNGCEVLPFPGTNWSILNPDNNTTWVRTTSASGLGTSTACFKMDNFTNDLTGQSDYILSPYMDFTSAVSPVQLVFNVAYQRYSTTSNFDSLIVAVTTNCGETWIRHYTKGGPSLSTVTTASTSAFTPTAAQWKTETINLSSYIGQADVRVRFQARSAFGNNLYIDDINIGTNVAAVTENNIKGLSIFPNPSSEMVNITWDSESNVESILIYNSVGQKVYSARPANSENSTQINLKPGVYFVSVMNNNGTETRNKIVITGN